MRNKRHVLLLAQLLRKLDLCKPAQPKRQVALLCLPGHAQTHNHSECLSPSAHSKTVSFLELRQRKNPGRVCEWPGTIKQYNIAGVTDGILVKARAVTEII